MAFERGWCDAERGLSFKANPYLKGTPDWLLWRNGWRALHDSLGLAY